MCRIASLYLLQRLKGSISGDVRDFNNIETRAVKFFSFLQGKAPKKIDAILIETLGEHAPSYATVENWVAQFKRGDFSTCVASHPWRPKWVTTPEIIDQIHELILEDRRISAKSIAEQLGISRERVGSIFHEDLDMRKLSAEWAPKCMNTDQKHQRCQSSEHLCICYHITDKVNDIFTILTCNFSKEQYVLPEDDLRIETCRSILSVLM